MHNAAFRHSRIDARYQAIEVPPAELAAWVKEVRNPDLLGFNVTVPHKEAIAPMIDYSEGDAELAGAVNTVITLRGLDPERPPRAPGKKTRPASEPRTPLIGRNTDTVGFRQSLKWDANVELSAARVVLLGAGGAARAVAVVALQDKAASLVVANRHVERATTLLQAVEGCNEGVTDISAISLDGAELAGALAEADVIVNATSVGLESTEVPVDPELIPAGSFVVDLIYRPRETVFLRAARDRGALVLGGLGMLVYQAAAAFEAWTYEAAPVELMRQAAEEALG